MEFPRAQAENVDQAGEEGILGRVSRLILDAGVRTVAIDALNVDETAVEGESPEGYPVHHAILGSGGVIAENLTNLAARASVLYGVTRPSEPMQKLIDTLVTCT